MLIWSNSLKTSAPSAPLTIFYAGTVNVFDDISAEKVPVFAQHIRYTLICDKVCEWFHASLESILTYQNNF